MNTGLWAREVRDQVIRPTLRRMGDRYASESAVRLLCMTAAHESGFVYLRQVGGPALGIYQMEPPTFRDHMTWIRGDLAAVVTEHAGPAPAAERIIGDMAFATIMARIHYWRRPEPLPDDVDGMAAYAKRWWNTPLGAATERDYADAFDRLFPPVTW